MISISDGKPAMAMPLILVIVVSMIKDAYEDYKRAKNDKIENNTKTFVLDPAHQSFVSTTWKSIRVGNIMRLKSDEPIPADMLLLHTSDVKGICYVETKNLDGETNLKIKTANKELQSIFVDEKKLSQIEGSIQCEGPNNAIYKFEGNMQSPMLD
jgi:phospholipid-transporting ATPase